MPSLFLIIIPGVRQPTEEGWVLRSLDWAPQHELPGNKSGADDNIHPHNWVAGYREVRRNKVHLTINRRIDAPVNREIDSVHFVVRDIETLHCRIGGNTVKHVIVGLNAFSMSDCVDRGDAGDEAVT